MIRLHLHKDAGALIGADSPELAVVLPDAARFSPPADAPPACLTPVGLTSCAEVGGASEGAESEGVWSEEGVAAEALVCRSALTENRHKIL